MFEGYLKQSTQVTVTVLMISSSDHIAGKTGLSAGLTIYATKAGAAPAAITPTVAELDSTNMPGLYSLVLTTTHTNTVGEFAIRVSGSGADPTDVKWQVSARLADDLAYPATSGRSMVVDANGLVDANTVKVGPTGSGTAQTARDIGASVLLSSGTGTGQLDFTSGVVKANITQLLGTAWLTPGTAGTPDVNVKLWNGLTTVALPLVPTTAGRTLDVSATGEAGLDWANIGSPTTAVALTGTTIATTQKVDIETIKTNPVVNAGTVTFPTTATLASTTNITAGTITTATNVTTVNGLAANVITAAATASDFGAEVATAVWQDATAGDFTVASSIGKALYTGNIVPGAAGGLFIAGSNAATTVNFTGNLSGSVGSVTGAVGSVTGAVGSVTGNVGGNVTGSVGSVAAGGITASSIAADAIGASELAADAVAEIADAVWDEVLSGHLTAGTTGNALNAAGSAGDPWSTSLPGAYGAGTAGKIIGDNLTGNAYTRLGAPAGASVSADIAAAKADTAAIKTKTDSLTFTVAGQIDANVIDWKGATAPAMTGDAFARLGAPAGASVSADIAAAKVDTAAIKVKTDFLPSATAGAAGGVFIAGTNAATTVSITGNITGNLSGSVGSVTTVSDKTGYRLSATGVDDVLDEVVDGTTTARESFRLANATLGGKASGLAGVTAVYRDLADTKNRISATVDADGNRSAVTRDLT